jgi:hypothetical protein
MPTAGGGKSPDAHENSMELDHVIHTRNTETALHGCESGQAAGCSICHCCTNKQHGSAAGPVAVGNQNRISPCGRPEPVVYINGSSQPLHHHSQTQIWARTTAVALGEPAFM